MKLAWPKPASVLALGLFAVLSPGCAGKPVASSLYTNPEFPGNYKLMSQRCYDHMQNTLPELDNADQDAVLSDLQRNVGTGVWTLSSITSDKGVDCASASQFGDPNEPKVSASDFIGNYAQVNDFYWYTGHGVFGSLTFFEWPSGTGSPCPIQGVACFSSSNPALPYNGRLKWVFNDASQSAYATYPGDPRGWYRAFNDTSQYGLHGWYGFLNHPGADPNSEQQLANGFFDAELQSTGKPNPVPIGAAWAAGASANGHLADAAYFELQSASQDKLSGPPPPGQPKPYTDDGQHRSNNQIAYHSYGPFKSNSRVLHAMDSTPHTYQRLSLLPENRSDNFLAQQADSHEGGSTKYYQSSNEYRIVSSSYTAQHYEASGGIVVETVRSSIPINYTESDALNFAQGAISQNEGMPPDAVLDQQIAHYVMDEQGFTTILGYDFIWRHSNGTIGGDRIQVGVDNLKDRVCTRPNENDPPYNKPPCYEWTTEYNLHVNYHYRLWRALGTPKALQRRGAAASVTNLTSTQALNLAKNQPANKGTIESLGTLQGYTYTYYTPPITATDNTAYSVYNFFYSSGTAIHVDGSSGKVYATSNLQ